MRTHLHIIAAMLVLVGCGPSSATRVEENALGWVDRTVLANDAHRAYQAVYDTCTIAPEFVEMISQVKGDVEYLVFFGTWCGDSRRHVPRFLKIADETGIPASRIRLYGLDRTKKSADGLTERYAIERVPTFILLKGGTEVGRITELPTTSMEADLLTLLVEASRR